MNQINLIREVLSRTPPTIDTKEECYTLYHAGIFGNSPLVWNTYEEVMNSGWRGEVCIRGRIPLTRGRVRYNIPLETLKDEVEIMKRETGLSDYQISFNQSMPDERLILQGELMRDNPFYLLYTTVKKPMNLALSEEEKHASGFTALNLLKANLFPSSFSDIEALVDRFPNSVFEFSAYEIAVGNIPGRNVVVWEGRNY